MHDTILLQKISEELEVLCKLNHLEKVSKLSIAVNDHSHVNEHNLYEHLHALDKELYGTEMRIDIVIEDIADQTAILYSIEGQKSE